MNLSVLIFAGILIHILFLKSVFVIYFTSPLVHGMTNQPINASPPAKRLVLISCDGLRSDKFYENDASGQPYMPFLRRISETKGVAGVSHTRVPTESRPGHVAMIAGFYEDVSAVTKGWKENPVEFDSVFNQSRWTWGWGSPDIIPIFTRIRQNSGELWDIPHIFPHTYSSEYEDFALSPVQLDFWVVDRVTELLTNAKHNATLMSMLNENKIIFFLHLLGMDTTGHVFKPQSQTYTDNMRLVDEKIADMMKVFDTFYGNDERTAYVFSSDHGMTDWGSHGSGQRDETETPLIAWGAGFPSQIDHDFSRVNLNIEQADLAPLMSSLIGIPIPANSVGILPLHLLETSAIYKATAFLTNAKQIYEQVRTLRNLKHSETFNWIFRPFPKLDEKDWTEAVAKLENEVEIPDNNTIDRINNLIHIGLEALAYYQQYDRHFLQFIVVQGYAGWIMFLLVILTKSVSQVGIRLSDVDHKKSVHLVRIGIITGVTAVVLLVVQGSPFNHIIYAVLPICSWTAALVEAVPIFKFISQHRNNVHSFISCIIPTLTFIAGMELVIFTFFYRSAVSVGLIVGGWWMCRTTQSQTWTKIGFITTAVSLAVFPLLPVVGNFRQIFLVVLTGIVASHVALLVKVKFHWFGQYRRTTLLAGQSLLLIFATFIVYRTSVKVDAQLSPGTVIHVISWSLLGLGFVVPFFGSTHVVFRFSNVAFSLLTSYLLMSVSYEALFFLILTAHLYFWIELESQDSLPTVPLGNLSIFDSLNRDIYTDTRLLKMADFRRAYFYVFLIMTSFFGTGNIASVNSFDPASAFCFVTVFRPFVMGAILLCKIVLPFLLTGCAFHVIHVACRVPMKSMCLVLMLMSDFMAVHFFFFVKTEGSWLDIGASISHYVMVMALIVFTSVLSYLSSILMSKSLPLPHFLRRYANIV